MVSVQPQCAIACIKICAHIKSPKHWGPCHCLDTWKYYTHLWEWVEILHTPLGVGGNTTHTSGSGWKYYTHLWEWVEILHTPMGVGGNTTHTYGSGWKYYTHLWEWVEILHTPMGVGGNTTHTYGSGWKYYTHLWEWVALLLQLLCLTQLNNKYKC